MIVNKMYYPYFITYMVIGFVLSLVVFYWAITRGQFSDQNRARFLPLQNEREAKRAKVSRIRRVEIYALAFLACSGLLASAAVLVFSLVRG
jgi:nitrogen fixation-related uncharacterized protein